MIGFDHAALLFFVAMPFLGLRIGFPMISGGGPPVTFPWQSLPVGAGGQLLGINITNDGTKVAWADTIGAYIYNPSALDARGVAGVWQQLATTSRLPSDAWSTPLSDQGTWAAAICPTNSNVIYIHYGQFAGSASRIYVSTNKGVSFARCGTFQQTTGSVNDQPGRICGPKMAVDPANPDYCITTTSTAGAFVTTNGRSGNSATWTAISAIAANNSVHAGCVAFDSPANPSFGTTGGITNKQYVSVSGTGLYATLNAGGTWALVAGTPLTIGWLFVASDGTLYALDYNNSFIKKLTWSGSTPTWTDVTPPGLGTSIDALVCDPNNAGHIIAFDYGNGGRYQESTNAGASWSTVNTAGMSLDTTQIPFHGNNLVSLLGGGMDIVWVSADPSTNPATIYACGPQTLIKTTLPMQAAGTVQPWTDVGGGIEQLDASVVCIPSPGKVLLGSADIPILSQSGPAVPSQYAQKLLWDRTHYLNVCQAMDYDPSGSGTVVAAVGGFPDGGPENSAVSTDFGVTWSAFPSFPSVSNGNSCMIACASATNWLYSRYSGQPAYTTDGGHTWNAISNPGGQAAPNSGWANASFLFWQNRIAADRVNGALYMQNIASGFAGTYVSTNGGATWTYNANSIDAAGAFGRLKAVPSNAGHLFYSCWNGSGGSFIPNTGTLFSRSTNGGASWSTVTGFYSVFAFGFGAPKAGQTYPSIGVYGYFNPGTGAQLGFWVSHDNAATWSLLNNVFPDGGMYPDGVPNIIADITGDLGNYGVWYFAKNGSGFSVGRFN